MLYDFLQHSQFVHLIQYTNYGIVRFLWIIYSFICWNV